MTAVFEVGLLALASLVVIVLAAYLPRTWRELRWAVKYGDEDERNIMRGTWWGHLATIVASLSFVAFAVRLLLVDRGVVQRPDLVVVFLIIADVCCVFLLVSQFHFRRRHRRRRSGDKNADIRDFPNADDPPNQSSPPFAL